MSQRNSYAIAVIISVGMGIFLVMVLLSNIGVLGENPVPTIDFLGPAPYSGEIIFDDSIQVNISMTATIQLFDATRTLINSSNGTSATFSNLESGVYYFNSTNGVNVSQTRNIVIVNPFL